MITDFSSLFSCMLFPWFLDHHIFLFSLNCCSHFPQPMQVKKFPVRIKNHHCIGILYGGTEASNMQVKHLLLITVERLSYVTQVIEIWILEHLVKIVSHLMLNNTVGVSSKVS